MRRSAPVVGVGAELDELPRHPLLEDERPGPHHLGVRVGVDLRLADVLPDVLRKDVDRQVQHRRVWVLGDHDDRRVVRRGHRLQVRDVVAVVGLLRRPVHDPVEGVRHVVCGERYAVRPLDAGTDGERPGQPVGRGLPRGRQAGHRGEVLRAVVRERVVAELEQLVRRREDADERVEGVHVLGDADGQRRLVRAGGGRGARRTARRQGCHRGHHREHDREGEDRADPAVAPTARRGRGIRHGCLRGSRARLRRCIKTLGVPRSRRWRNDARRSGRSTASG